MAMGWGLCVQPRPEWDGVNTCAAETLSHSLQCIGHTVLREASQRLSLARVRWEDVAPSLRSRGTSWLPGAERAFMIKPFKRALSSDPIKQVASVVPTRHTWSLFEEFKNFAFKGNVVDLAVGVIIGAAFGKIVDALVKDIIMPLVSVVLPGQQSYQEWKAVIHGKEIPYGLFLGEVVNFLIIAVVLFLFIVKFLGWLMRTRHEEVADPPPPTKEEVLLTEIRDLLREEVHGAGDRHG
jgi:large conductance mechanosensitive channel